MRITSPFLPCATACGLFAASIATAATPAPDLKPLMAVADQVVVQDDFSKAGPFNKQQWGARQGTQWVVEDGVLRGRPSTPAFQAKQKSHFGYEPRISAPATPAQFIARFSVRFNGGSETPIAPFVEFGHHVCRLCIRANGSELVADGESTKVAEAKDFKYEPGKWYHMLVEMKGDEIVIQVAGGPTFVARHECFAKAPASGGNGLGVAGPKDGIAELDDVTIWSVKPETQSGWAAKRKTFPTFAPVVLKATKKTVE